MKYLIGYHIIEDKEDGKKIKLEYTYKEKTKKFIIHLNKDYIQNNYIAKKISNQNELIFDSFDQDIGSGKTVKMLKLNAGSPAPVMINHNVPYYSIVDDNKIQEEIEEREEHGE